MIPSGRGEPMHKANYKQALMVVAVTTIAGEILIYPSGHTFQFSIASAVFMYSILSLPNLLIIPTGSLSALCIFVMGVLLDSFLRSPELPLELIVGDRFLEVLYFVFLAVFLQLGGINKFSGMPFTARLAGFMVAADLSAKLLEVSFRGVLLDLVNQPVDLAILVVGSLVQVFLVFSLLNISHFKQIRVLDDQARLRFERTLIITSNLYDEFFFMRKSAENMEKIMAESYRLYKMLKEGLGPGETGAKEAEELALKIAEEVHEVKKDTYRIQAGLSKVIDFRKEVREMYLSELFELVIKANRNYSQQADKQIQFHLETAEDFTVKRIHPLLAIMNHIVENAVEAISQKGNIYIQSRMAGEHLQVTISDDGRRINPKDRDLIFEPGYTTKFNDKGIPSTGIGLAYVKGLMEDLGGRVTFEQTDRRKRFILTFPREEIGG
jgi:two-component system, sensor histidine kinase YcbA